MFWLFLIYLSFWIYKSTLEKKDKQFLELLAMLKFDETTDNVTIDATIEAHNLLKKSKLPFYKVLDHVRDTLSKRNDNYNKYDTNYNNTTENNENQAYSDELEGQIKLFDDQPAPSTPGYIPPTPFGVEVPIPTNANQPIDVDIPMQNNNNVEQPIISLEPIFLDKPIQSNENLKQPFVYPQDLIKPIKKPIDIDPSSIVLILGVILVLTSAVIFSTTIWDSVSSLSKIGILLSLALINFLISFAFFKRFERKSPSAAFYVMGYSFISFSVIAFGYFYVSADYTKIFTNMGWLFTLSFFATIICIFSFYGYKIYRNTNFLWTTLFCTDAIIFALSKAVFIDINFVLLILAIYAVTLVYLLNYDKINQSNNSDISNNIIFGFSKYNILVISLASVVVTGANLFTILICSILACGFLLSNNKQFKDDSSAILFCLLMMIGLFKTGYGDNMNTAFLLLSFFPVITFIFKLMNILDEQLQKHLNLFTLISSLIIFFTNSFYNFALSEPSLYSLLTLIILFVTVTFLNTYSQYKYVHPILLTVIISELQRLLEFNRILDGSLISFYVALLLFGVFLFYTYYKKYNLNSIVAQNIFPIFMFFTCFNTEFIRATNSTDYMFIIYYTILFITCYVINAINEDDINLQYVYATLATLPTATLIPPIMDLISNPALEYTSMLALFIFTIAVLLFYCKQFELTKKFIIPINIIYLVLAHFVFISGVISTNSAGYDISLFLLFISLCALYFSQWYLHEGTENITVKYIYPFILVIDSFIVILNNCQENMDIFFYISTALVAISTILIKPNSSFRLPFNTVTFILTVFLWNVFIDKYNSFYLLSFALIIHYIYQLYTAYKTDEINERRNAYIFILLALLFVLSPSMMISQLVISLALFGYVVLVSKFPTIKYLQYSIMLFNVLLNLFLLIQVLDGYDRDNMLLQLLVSGFSLIAITFVSGRNNLISGIGVFCMYFLSIDTIHRLLIPLVDYELSLIAPIFAVNILLYFSKFITLEGFNQLTQKVLYEKNTEPLNILGISMTIPLSKIDYYSFVGIIGVLSLLFEGLPSPAFLMLALYFLNFTRRGFMDDYLITGSVASFCLTLITQELLTIPRLYQTEYEVLICLGFLVALRYIWKEKIHPTTYFIAMILTIGRLFIDVMEYKEVFDAILLGVGIIGLLLYGLYVKHRKIIIISITSLLLLITYISFAFWNNSYWFAYLILTGIFLIGLSLHIENKKKNSK